MAVLDTLEILIEADASGLTTQLSKAGNTISQFVDKMNTQQVDWTSILSASISPAIITGIASMFANAIVQYTQFSSAANNLNNVATSGTGDLTDSINTTGGAVYQLAETAGASLGDTTSAFEQFSKAGLDSAAATAAVTDAAGIARDTGESMGSVVSELVTLFQQWGVTSAPQVTAALTGLTNAASNGQFTFDELVDAIGAQGPLLQGKTNITDLATSLAALSTQSGLSKTVILDTFNALSQGIASPVSSMNILFAGASNAISDGPTGLVTAFQKIQTTVTNVGPLVASSFATSAGLMQGDATAFATAADKMPTGMQNAATAANNLLQNMTPLDTLLKTDEPIVAKLAADWNTFSDYVAAFTLPAGLNILDTALKDIGTSMTAISALANGTSADKVGDWLKSLAGGAGLLGVGAAALAGAGTGAELGAAAGTFLGGPVGAAVGGLAGGLIGGIAGGAGAFGLINSGVNAVGNPADSGTASEIAEQLALHGGGTNFSDSQVTAINANAQMHGDIQQLIAALTNGISTKSSSYATLTNNFNLTAPPGATTLTAQQIAAQLYKQFQGTQ